MTLPFLPPEIFLGNDRNKDVFPRRDKGKSLSPSVLNQHKAEICCPRGGSGNSSSQYLPQIQGRVWLTQVELTETLRMPYPQGPGAQGLAKIEMIFFLIFFLVILFHLF